MYLFSRNAGYKGVIESMQYRGENFARQYWKLWEERNHIVRIVDTSKLLDADNLERSITFDVDNLSLQKHRKVFLFSSNFESTEQTKPSLDRDAKQNETSTLSGQSVENASADSNPQSRHKTFVLPFLLLRKHPLIDVDAKGRSNTPMHLCRRSVNIDISGHIIVGLCLSLGFKGDQGEQRKLYRNAVGFLGQDRAPSGAKKKSAKEDLVNLAEKFGVYSSGNRVKLKTFLDLLTLHYIQCLEYPYTDESSDPTTIIKVRVSDSLKLLTNASLSTDNFQRCSQREGGGQQRYLYDDQKSMKKAEPKEAKVESDEINQRSFRSRIREFGEFIGVLSTTIEIPLQLGSTKVRPSRHEIFIAPVGTQIGGAFLIRNRDRDRRDRGEAQPNQSNATIVTHTSERASLLIRDRTKNGYAVQVKLNPVLSALIIPAYFVCILQLAISSIALFEGPEVVARNAIAFTGTAVVAPFVTVVFIAKDSEHDMVSRLLACPRMLLALSSALLVISGAFMAVLPRKEIIGYSCRAAEEKLEATCQPTYTGDGFTSSHLLGFIGLSLVSFIAVTTISLLSRIIWRTARGSLGLRRRAQEALDRIELDFDENRIAQIEDRCRKRTLFWNTVGVALILIGAVATFFWCHLLWWPAINTWT